MDRIEDLDGQEWIVNKDSPSWGVVQKLRAAGFRYIVLPIEVLVGIQADVRTVPIDFAGDVVRQVRVNDEVIALGLRAIESVPDAILT